MGSAKDLSWWLDWLVELLIYKLHSPQKPGVHDTFQQKCFECIVSDCDYCELADNVEPKITEGI